MNEAENDLKQRILNNAFVDTLRIEMRFEHDEFRRLCMDMNELALSLRGAATIDRELMLTLYCMPLMVRNQFLRQSKVSESSEFTNQLEDAWVELDRLVTECLATGSPTQGV